MKPTESKYLFDPAEKPALPQVSVPQVSVPLVVADDAALDGYGRLVEDPEQCEVEIVKWPAQGWRPIDDGTGDEGGITQGIFHCHWKDRVLMGRNEAVNGEYVLGWGARQDHITLWHMNYHPDGGQLFSPSTRKPSSSL